MKKINLWVVRPNPAGNNRIEEFFEKNIIAIGGFNIPNLLNIYKWENLELKNKLEDPKLMDNFDYSSRNNKWIRNNIKIKLTKINPDDTSSQKIALHAGVLFRFFQEIKEEDIVFVPDKNKLHIAQVMGPYIYSTEDREEEYPHQRKVRWIQKNIDRESIPPYLQKSLSSKLTLYSISDNYDKIMEFIREVIPEEYSEYFKPSYEYLEEAVYIEVMTNYSVIFSPQPTIFKLAKKNINNSTIERAKKIAEKVKVFCGNSKWKNGWWLYEEEWWIDEIMDWIKEDRLEEVVEEEKERLFNEAEKEMKEALEIADQEDDLEAVIKVIDSLDDMDKNIEDFRNKVISNLMPKLDENKQDFLEKADQKQTINSLLSYMKNSSEEEKENFRKMLKDHKKEV